MGWDPQTLLKVVVCSVLGTSGTLAKVKVNTIAFVNNNNNCYGIPVMIT